MPTGYSLVLNAPGIEHVVWNLLPSPEDIMSQKVALTTLVPIPDSKVYREGHGVGIETVTLRGSFGSKTREFQGLPKSGAEMFLDFRKNFWTRYQEIRANTDPVKRAATIEYHSWDEDEHWFCEPMTFNTPRGKDNRTFFRYDLTLKLYEKIQRKFNIPTLDKISLIDQALKFLKNVADKIKAAGEFLSSIPDRVNSIINRYILEPVGALIEAMQLFVSGVTTVVLFPIRTLNKITDSIGDAIEGLGDLVGETMHETANVLRNTRRTMDRLKTTPEVFSASVDSGLTDLSEQYYQLVGEDDPESLQEEKRGGRNLQLMQQASKIKDRSYQGATRETVREGDTLQQIAARTLHDATRWREIALINGLDTTDVSSLAGQSILVPSIPGVAGSGVVGDLGDTSRASNDTMAERLYGRDLRLAKAGNYLSWTFGPDNDLATIGGEANLVQAVLLKTKTQQGQLLENLDYGLRNVIGRKANIQDNRLLQHGLQESAASDPRIEQAEVTIQQDSNVLTVGFQLWPVGVAGSRPIDAVTNL